MTGLAGSMLYPGVIISGLAYISFFFQSMRFPDVPLFWCAKLCFVHSITSYHTEEKNGECTNYTFLDNV